MNKRPTKPATTASRTFPNRKAALDNAKRLVADHQITRSIYKDIEREIAKPKRY